MDSTTTFDPTSQANLTASAILFLGLACIVSASYSMGTSRVNDGYVYNASIGVILSAVTLVMCALYILFAYD